MLLLLIGVLNLLGLFLIAFGFWKRVNASIKIFYWPALALKVTCGILLGLLYTYYYSANDTFYFFDAAVTLSRTANTNFVEYLSLLFEPDSRYFDGEARSLFFIKVVSVFALLTHENYWITSIYFSLITFFASWFLVESLVKNIQHIRSAAVVAFLFFPSAIFWSSGIIKESLTMAGLYLVAGIVIEIWCKQRVNLFIYLLSVFAIIVIWNLKYYYIGLFLPIVLSALIVNWIRPVVRVKSFAGELILFLVLICCMLFSATFIHPNFNLSTITDVIVINNYEIVKLSVENDVIHFSSLQPSLISILINSPWALVSCLFRPFIWEVNSAVQFFAALENLIFLCLVGVALVNWKLIKTSKFRVLILAGLTYCLLLAIFLALSSPNFGTLARYKVGFLSFLVFMASINPVIQNVYHRIIYFGRD